MQLHGKHLIGATSSSEGEAAIQARNAFTGEALTPSFHEATPGEVNRAVEASREAFPTLRWKHAPEERARLLEQIADEIEALGDGLVRRVTQETAIGEGRVTGERGRTTGQLRMFADLVREGSWVDARIDRATDGAPDVRRMLVPLGPVAVFGASNFPLAFSVAGGDTASALAAGCPVVVKAHPGHPGTSEMVGRAIRRAVEAVGFPEGTFSMVHGADPEVSLALVRHPALEAVGFTGSLEAGRAIFDAAAQRPKPIPVHAEMGSTNPVFLLPEALESRAESLAKSFSESLTLGAGQFCTNPGLVFALRGEPLGRLVEETSRCLRETPASAMLHEGIQEGYAAGVKKFTKTMGVRMVGRSEGGGDGTAAEEGAAALFATDVDTYRSNDYLQEEVFGPSSLVVEAGSAAELLQLARELEGQLTATIHGTPEDLSAHADLVHVLESKVGRLIFNGYPTGVRVSPAMQHGGPYPATTDARSTSVGTAAIERFARPVCYQDFPQEALPPELQDNNPRGVWRLEDAEWTRP